MITSFRHSAVDFAAVTNVPYIALSFLADVSQSQSGFGTKYCSVALSGNTNQNHFLPWNVRHNHSIQQNVWAVSCIIRHAREHLD